MTATRSVHACGSASEPASPPTTCNLGLRPRCASHYAADAPLSDGQTSVEWLHDKPCGCGLKRMNITVFGAGYVGLVTGACFAEMGNQVACVDVDEARVSALERDEVPIYEPGLPELTRGNRQAGRLTFTSNAERGIGDSEVIFIAVGTPSGEDGSADLRHVMDVANAIGECVGGSVVVAVKSTVPVGTGERVRTAIAEGLERRGVAFDVAVAVNPEFLKEGAAVADFMKPDRIIVGCDDGEAAALLERLYAPFNRNHDKVLHMDMRSAELTKYAANVMLATRISLMNEFSNLADRLGVDIEAVRQGIGADPRIGYQYIYPGCGYGGSCFPKDVRALLRMASDVDCDASIVRGVEAVNERQKLVLIEKLTRHFGGSLEGRVIGIWGLSFKPNTDDMREAPSCAIMEAAWQAGATVRAYDPQALDSARQLYGQREDLVLCGQRDDVPVGADALLVATEWNEFRSPDFAIVKAALKTPVIADGRNLYDPARLAEMGFTHLAIGRGGGRPS